MKKNKDMKLIKELKEMLDYLYKKEENDEQDRRYIHAAGQQG